VLKLGELVAFIRADDSDFERGLGRAERRFDRFGEHVAGVADAAAAAATAAGGRAGDGFANGFWRDANGRLHNARGRFAAEGQALGGSLGGGFVGGLGSAMGAVLNMTSSVSGLVVLLFALGAAAAFAVPIIYTLGGALGAIPALATGAGFGIAALAIGFIGLGAAFKQTAAGGGSAAAAADRVSSAERGLANAQRDAADAAEAVNRAREDEIERLEDLTRSLARARFNEGSATRAVAKAERDLAKARAGGNSDKITEAEAALEQAKLDLDDVKDRVEDLSKEREKADKVGVEGSDQVKAALDRQRMAAERIIDAEAALRQARTSGSGGAAAEVTKLAPAAAETVAVIKSLKAVWEDLRLSVQQRLFAGVPGEVKDLARVWLPFLKGGLGRYADTFNAIFKVFSGSVQEPEFIRRTEIGLEAVRGLVDDIGRAVGGPFVDAWGRLSRASAPFIKTLGKEIAELITDFSEWIEKADKTGDLDTFFEKASHFLSQIFTIGRSVLSILGSVIAIFFGSDTGERSESQFDKMVAGLQRLDEWLADPENREQVREWIDAVLHFARWIKDEAIPAVKEWVTTLQNWSDRIDGWIERVRNFRDGVREAIDSVVGFINSMPERVTRAAGGLWDGLRDSFKAAVNWIIDRWNGLSFGLPSTSFFGVQVGGGRLDTPDIPRLAAGGTALEAGMAMVAEHGPERIFMPKGAVAQPLAPGWRNQGQGGAMRIVGELLVRGTGLLSGLREYVAVNGGEVQEVLG
jgi:hypothetical protein